MKTSLTYIAGRAIQLPEVNVLPKTGDEYHAIRGMRFVLAVKRDGEWVGFVDSGQIGFMNAGDALRARVAR